MRGFLETGGSETYPGPFLVLNQFEHSHLKASVVRGRRIIYVIMASIVSN